MTALHLMDWAFLYKELLYASGHAAFKGVSTTLDPLCIYIVFGSSQDTRI